VTRLPLYILSGLVAFGVLVAVGFAAGRDQTPTAAELARTRKVAYTEIVARLRAPSILEARQRGAELGAQRGAGAGSRAGRRLLVAQAADRTAARREERERLAFARRWAAARKHASQVAQAPQLRLRIPKLPPRSPVPVAKQPAKAPTTTQRTATQPTQTTPAPQTTTTQNPATGGAQPQ
jgi:hypothetical protein